MLWKDSLDFVAIVKAKNVDEGAMSIEQKVDQILKERNQLDPRWDP